LPYCGAQLQDFAGCLLKHFSLFVGMAKNVDFNEEWINPKFYILESVKAQSALQFYLVY
jgi:hypothetical protein